MGDKVLPFSDQPKDLTGRLGASTYAWNEAICLLPVLLIACLCFLPGLGSFGPLDPTDSFFIESAREMIEHDHYVTALYNYADWLDKPGLAFWPIILSCKLLGMNSWAARIPAAISGITLIIAVYIFARRLLGKRSAILSAVVLCASPLFIITGRVALPDELLSMFFGIFMLYAAVALSSPKQKLDLWAYVFLALAILTKGPITLILALLAIALYLFTTNNSLSVALDKLKDLRPIAGIAILLLLCLPYYYLAHTTTDGAFTIQFFLHQNMGRFLGVVNHQEPIWFYLPILLGGYFPWILYFFMSIPWLKHLYVRRSRLSQRQSMIIFCCCWAATVLLLFTLVPTKLPTYIVPFSPALAIIVGTYLDCLIRTHARLNNRHKLIISIPPLLIFLAGLACLSLMPILAIKTVPAPILVSSTLTLIVILTVASCSAFWQRKLTYAATTLSLASILACVVLIPCSFQWFYQTHQMSINRLAIIAKDKNANLATLFSWEPSVVFTLRRKVPAINSLPELASFCQTGQSPHFLLATKNCLQIPKLQAQRHVVASDGRWYLLNIEGFPWQTPGSL